MPLAQITIADGTSDDRKRALIADVTDVLARATDSTPQAVRVLLTEIPAAHWGVGGIPLQDLMP